MKAEKPNNDLENCKKMVKRMDFVKLDAKMEKPLTVPYEYFKFHDDEKERCIAEKDRLIAKKNAEIWQLKMRIRILEKKVKA